MSIAPAPLKKSHPHSGDNPLITQYSGWGCCRLSTLPRKIILRSILMISHQNCRFLEYPLAAASRDLRQFQPIELAGRAARQRIDTDDVPRRERLAQALLAMGPHGIGV